MQPLSEVCAICSRKLAIVPDPGHRRLDLSFLALEVLP